MAANDSDAVNEGGFAHDEECFFNEAETQLHEPELGEERPFSSITPTVLDTGDTDEPFLLLNRVENQPTPLDAAFEARRKRLRKAVAATLCASAALLLLAVGRHPPRAIHPRSGSVPPRMSIAAAAIPRAQEPLPEKSPVAQPIGSASVATSIDDDNAARESAHALLLSARSLLQAGRIRAGVEAARQALAANGNDAEPYILLAAGLQDLGDWSGAQRVFAACKAQARSGSQAECSYFSGQKH
ncbi:MAG TPA: hypothetical protein VER96_29620 [Polyangiaceae bacterium]|nr:hypothetical protein [Polyangiaceae bacterium]